MNKEEEEEEGEEEEEEVVVVVERCIPSFVRRKHGRDVDDGG